ncbi:MAG: rhomboid family intramembrane serine protease [Candidatus Aenigmarchaeota archaeon]|nr:rhomboid family intramembrane serine protease [Candidatus Aenigmarchaeota archaeon]
MGRLTWALIILNVIVFELVFSMPEALLKQMFDLFAFSSPHLLEVWRLITSLFLHASASHLFFNMLGLYFFGKVLEGEVKPKKFLLIYFLSGIAGNLVYGFTSSTMVVGASGCVFGLMGFAMLMKPKKMINLYVFPLPLGVIAILYAVVETLLVYFGEAVSGVAHVAHIAGLVIGVLFAFRMDPKRAGKGLLWLIAFLAILVLLGPILGLIMGIGNFILGAFDFVVGIVLYGLAKLLGLVLW